MLQAEVGFLLSGNHGGELPQIADLQCGGLELERLPILVAGAKDLDRLQIAVRQVTASQVRNDTRAAGAWSCSRIATPLSTNVPGTR